LTTTDTCGKDNYSSNQGHPAVTVLHKKSDVSISFHYLIRNISEEKDEVVETPISEEEFEYLFENLRGVKMANLQDEETETDIRFKKLVALERLEKFNGRYITGVYKTSYWGHSYENTEKGEITASSLNLRPFYFLLYLSESGRIYIGSQYLGSYGGYTALKNTILRCMKQSNQIMVRSFNSTYDQLEGAQPKEVEIQIARRSESITSGNFYGQAGAFAFKKQHKDDGFEEKTSNGFLKHLFKSKSEIRKGIAKTLQQNQILDVADDEIQGCKILVQLESGRKQIIQLLDHRHFASRFPAEVPLQDDGHPHYEMMKTISIEMLKEQIISVKENV